MFEATFKIAALVESNEQGQRVFQVLKHADPADDAGFLSLVAMVYQQNVYRTLQVGDDLTVTVHLDFPPETLKGRCVSARTGGLREKVYRSQP